LEEIENEKNKLLQLKNIELLGWIMFPLSKKNGEIKTGHFTKFFRQPPLSSPPYLKKDYL